MINPKFALQIRKPSRPGCEQSPQRWHTLGDPVSLDQGSRELAQVRVDQPQGQWRLIRHTPMHQAQHAHNKRTSS